MTDHPTIVIPAKAGTHPVNSAGGSRQSACYGWIPAFAGMTAESVADL